MLTILIFIVLVSIVSVGGSLYARIYGKADVLIGTFVGCTIISNILVYKIASYDLGFTTIYATAPTMVFAITYLITDIVNERFGRKETMKMIAVALFTQLCASLFIYVAIHLPSAPFWKDQEVYDKVFNNSLRIFFSGMATFAIVETFDAYVFHWFKGFTKGKHLWARSVFSSLPAMLLDTVLFFSFAFYGVIPLMSIIPGVVPLLSG